MAQNQERQSLKDWRLARNLTVDELARKAGVAQSTVSVAERGINAPRYATMEALAKALDINPSQIVWPEAFKRPPRNKGQRRGPRRPKEEE